MPRRRRPRRIEAAVPEQVAATVLAPVYAERRPGHPTLLTEEVLVRFLAAIQRGAPRSTAAHLAGLDSRRIREWIARGEGRAKRPPSPEYTRFARLVEQAEAAAEFAISDALFRKAQKGDVPAMLAWLRARHPENWSGMEVAPEGDGGNVAVNITNQQNNVVYLPLDRLPTVVDALLEERRPAPAIAAALEEARGARRARLDRLVIDGDD